MARKTPKNPSKDPFEGSVGYTEPQLRAVHSMHNLGGIYIEGMNINELNDNRPFDVTRDGSDFEDGADQDPSRGRRR